MATREADVLIEQTGALDSRRKKPEDWSGLLAVAGKAVDEAGNYILTSVEPLFVAIDELDAFRLDSSRYYALGLIICRFARGLDEVTRDEAKADKLADTGARLMVNAREQRKAGEGVSGFRLQDTSKAFAGVFTESTDDMPNDFRLLANALEDSSNTRSSLAEVKMSTRIALVTTPGKQIMFDRVSQDPYAGMVFLEQLAFASQAPDIPILRDPKILQLGRGLAAIPLHTLDEEVLEAHARKQSGEVKPMDWKQEKHRQQAVKAEIMDNGDYDPHVIRLDRLVCPAATIPRMFPMMHQLASQMFVRALELAA
jgi:hypothetical protein